MDAIYGACCVWGCCVIAVKCSSQRKYCFLRSSNNSFFVSIFSFLFWWSHLVSTCLMFPGHQGAWERFFVVKETTEWVFVFTWTWLSCSGLPGCTVLDRTAGVFVRRLDYSMYAKADWWAHLILIAFWKIVHGNLSESKTMLIHCKSCDLCNSCIELNGKPLMP